MEGADRNFKLFLVYRGHFHREKPCGQRGSWSVTDFRNDPLMPGVRDLEVEWGLIEI